ncbi:MAG: hypothetical protein HQL84_07535 [Magnetococcales bacterium]|nr:hypothetical protein [Magnetococcales bacterium]MBF0149883.1 hypothetical protein [Magnetococcales bacterium]MBF0174174.1 hypothetical protein [Magnetococcales bacterium]MBF0346537.1 hypothetical protein [Magnetococcales bacterium]MBF0631865.1 hypothetical protein [Magnetococcales bacterium]
MRLSPVLASLLLLSAPWGDLQAAEIFKSGPFTVRKVDNTCKLEIQLHENDRQPAAILALFPAEDYYGELFTEKSRIGLAHEKVTVKFDNDKVREIPFVPDAAAKDAYWRWQYLETTEGILDNVARKGKMLVDFSNGKQSFSYTVVLKGSGKAVKSVRSCK